MQRLLFHNSQCPGDVVVMTAAVRELHRQYPGQYQTDVRTCAQALWEHNPYLTPIADGDRDVRNIEMHYPLINQSNQRPVHFLEGYCDYLAGQLGLASLRPHEFKGDIHLSDEERRWMNQVEETTGYRGPFWLVNAGSKNDFTCKQWPQESFQQVIDHFRGRITFVQIGASEHNHPPLTGAIDLRGKTDHRQLIRLVYHAAGVLTGVSYPMHLAAAVPWSPLLRSPLAPQAEPSLPTQTPPNVQGEPTQVRPRSAHGVSGLRPCVVINGGREPPHWEQYPGHQFLHTIGALDCCATGGCWKSRVTALGDGDHKDRDLCRQPVAGHPRCMRLITPDEVIRAIELYAGQREQGTVEREIANCELQIANLKLAAGHQAREEASQAQDPNPKTEDMNPKSKIQNPKLPVLIDFRHGLGDTVQFTTVLLHLRHYHPDWQIDVAAGIGKLPDVGRREQGIGNRGISLYHRFLARDRDPIDRRAYKHVFELSWDECPTCYADSPSTKAEHCLRSVFKLEPVPELCRYEIPVGQRAWLAARSYLQSICGPTRVSPTDDGQRTTDKFPAVLLHYQANTSTEKKDLPHELARQVCEAAIEAGFVPVILDWDKRTPLADGVRIFNPGADSSLWGNIGTGDSEVLAALIAQSTLFIGVDSGPLHVAGATAHCPASVGNGAPPGPCGVPRPRKRGRDGTTSQDASAAPNLHFDICNSQFAISTPVLAVWTAHHPLHYFCPADHVTHLVPDDHASHLRGDRAIGRAYFDEHYRSHVYRQLAVDLPALVTSALTGEPLEQSRNKEFLRQLHATGYTESYYLEHKLAGLDYLGFGDWQRQYGRWLTGSLCLRGKRVLDVGCACGSIVRGLAQAGTTTQGVDLCEAMVRRGREEWPDLAGRLHVCDAVNLHLFADAAFDAIHTSQVAEHWKPELVPFILRELSRVVVPGGLMFCALDTEELFARQGRRLEHEDPTHVCVRPMRWWHEQLASSGWQVCTADYEPRLRRHPDTFLTRYDWDWFVAMRDER